MSGIKERKQRGKIERQEGGKEGIYINEQYSYQ
jgi:hypothetical protein